jgi:hypothetical protein
MRISKTRLQPDVLPRAAHEAGAPWARHRRRRPSKCLAQRGAVVDPRKTVKFNTEKHQNLG